MKIYLASNYADHPRMRIIKEVLGQQNIKVTSRWINGEHAHLEGGTHQEMNARFAREDLEDLESAEVVVVFNEPGPRSSRGGKHLELGYALAIKKRIILIGQPSNVFHYLPEIEIIEDVSDLIQKLIEG